MCVGLLLVLACGERPDDGDGGEGGGGGACDEGCHWDCFGGSECVDGIAWQAAYAPRECCHYADPWPDDSPICGAHAVPCASGACTTPDPRYAACLTNTVDWACPDGNCDVYLRLWCATEPPHAGTPCTSDADCRPVPDGASRLECQPTGGTSACVEVARPSVAPETCTFDEDCPDGLVCLCRPYEGSICVPPGERPLVGG